MINSIAPNKQAQIKVTGLQLKTEQELKFYHVVIDGAKLADHRGVH